LEGCDKLMTDLEIAKYQYFMMKKMCREVQGTLHHVTNMHYSDRHIGDLEDCKEQSCQQFWKTMKDLDDLPAAIKRNEVKGQRE